jgi:sortase A
LGRALRIAGAASAVLAALALLFGAYQLWGTGLGAARAQARLRSELRRELRLLPAHHAAGVAAPEPVPAPSIPPPSAGQPVGTIDIPSIGLDEVVVEGVAAADLALGPGHYPGTPLPGEAGDVAIAGHRTTYLHPFYDLTAVAEGDLIVITTPQGVFTYAAQDEHAVPPTDVAIIGPSATPTLTLTTCNPRYSAAARLVLKATLVRSVLAAGTPGASVPSPVRTPKGRGRTGDPAPKASRAGSVATTGRHLGSILGWGAATLATFATTWLVASRCRRVPVRWVVWSNGAALGLVALFFFFGAMMPVVPAGL